MMNNAESSLLSKPAFKMNVEQTKTYTTIKIETFITPEGKLTCSAGLGKDCKFLRVTRWGCTFVCGYNNAELNRDGGEGYGFLLPDVGCPLIDIKE